MYALKGTRAYQLCVSLKPNKYVESVSSSLKHLTVLKDWLVNEILTLLHKNINIILLLWVKHSAGVDCLRLFKTQVSVCP